MGKAARLAHSCSVLLRQIDMLPPTKGAGGGVLRRALFDLISNWVYTWPGCFAEPTVDKCI